MFRRDDCPEYETVSYTWGGEEDDSTPCRPVFVGPRWDVLLQTANCWHMLRYVRPRRGIRLVWIDVICINQDEPAERALQVPNMRSVYQQCSRVVIYPGADLVAPPTSGIEARMHPPRHGLHEFDRVMGPSLGQREIAMTLPDLLARRYFSRVWVIQELILSRAAIIPIAGREFWATALTPIKYQDARKFNNSSSPDRWDWESSTVPWMRDLCGGSFHVGTTLFDVLCRTWQSKATDPRDFGVLGLVDSKSSITPDYNISVQHVFTGIMAHALLNLRITEVLLRASGLAAPPSHPSWLPDKDGISERRPRGFYDFRGNPYHLAISAPPPTTEDYLEQSIVTFTHLGSLPIVQHLSGTSKGDNVEFDTTGLDDQFSDYCLSFLKVGGPWNERQISLPDLYSLHSWRAGATVDSSTGDLLLKAGHLLQFDSSPQKAHNLLGIPINAQMGMTQYVIREGWCSLFVSVPGAGPALDKYVSAGKNHLFYLEKEDIRDITDDYVFLFMREVEGADIGSCHDASRPREFKLILCYPCQDIFFMFRKAKLPNSSKAHNRSMHQIDVRHSLYATLIGVRNEIWGQTSTWTSPPQYLEHRGLR